MKNGEGGDKNLEIPEGLISGMSNGSFSASTIDKRVVGVVQEEW